jgi:hypothetical protein
VDEMDMLTSNALETTALSFITKVNYAYLMALLSISPVISLLLRPKTICPIVIQSISKDEETTSSMLICIVSHAYVD